MSFAVSRETEPAVLQTASQILTENFHTVCMDDGGGLPGEIQGGTGGGQQVKALEPSRPVPEPPKS